MGINLVLLSYRRIRGESRPLCLTQPIRFRPLAGKLVSYMAIILGKLGNGAGFRPLAGKLVSYSYLRGNSRGIHCFRPLAGKLVSYMKLPLRNLRRKRFRPLAGKLVSYRLERRWSEPDSASFRPLAGKLVSYARHPDITSFVRLFSSPCGEIGFLHPWGQFYITELYVFVPLRGNWFLTPGESSQEGERSWSFRPLAGKLVSYNKEFEVVKKEGGFRPLAGKLVSYPESAKESAKRAVFVPLRGNWFLTPSI